MAEVVFTDGNLQEQALDVKDKLIMIDFFAAWCGPCQMMMPHVDELASEITDAVIGKCNVDDSPGVAQKFQVMSIPTVVFLKNGEIVEKLVGYQAKEVLAEKINELK
ncbi:thioredoxin [Candidatus Peregrinibacteria bacterium]|jgi:thioredoxin 1|nr:thioredoxin [Candidatus Peregrinibacteria bacterium]